MDDDAKWSRSIRPIGKDAVAIRPGEGWREIWLTGSTTAGSRGAGWSSTAPGGEPNAMVLATVADCGKPVTRSVLCKIWTSPVSRSLPATPRQGEQLAVTPYASAFSLVPARSPGTYRAQSAGQHQGDIHVVPCAPGARSWNAWASRVAVGSRAPAR